MTKGIYYNRTNTCDICGNKLIPHNARRELDNKGNWTGRWLCNKCWVKFDYHKRLGTHHNIMKQLRDSRTGNLDPYSSKAKGDLFEELTCRWKGVKNLNIENDNYRSPIDHSPDELGIIYQTKGKIYDSINQRWSISFRSEHNAIRNGYRFDFVILYCASKDGKIIERIYIFPKEEVMMRTSITIVKNPSTWPPWYEQYRIKDEETMKKVNDIWKEIIS